MRPAGFEPATKGFKASPRFREARTISSSRVDVAKSLREAGRSSAGIIVGAHPASL